MTAYATVDTAVTAMKLGAYDYLVKPFDPEELSLMVQKIVAQQALVRENVHPAQGAQARVPLPRPGQQEPAMQAVFELARTAARSHSTILVLGESGTGKELLARADPRREPRATTGPSSRSPAPRSPRRCSSRSCSATRRAPSPAPPRAARASSRPRTAARCSSTRSATSARSCSSTCCASSRSARFTRVGGNRVGPGRRAHHRRHQPGPPKAVADGRFREDLFYRLNVIPITCRRCASGARTSRCSSSTSSSSSASS